MNKNNIIAIVQARLSSSRFPRKVLTPLLGKPVLAHVVNRIKKAQQIDNVVIATTNQDEDLEIVDWCKANHVTYFRGDLNDVLSRFYHCAQEFKATHIVRVTSDNPLVDPAIIDLTIAKLLNENADYVANNLEKTFPHGLDVEFFTMQALSEAFNKSKEAYEREHVTQYIRKNPLDFKISNLSSSVNLHDIRLTLDEKQDYELIEIVMKLLNEDVSLTNIQKLFEKYPSLKKINAESKARHQAYNSGQKII